MVLLSRDNGTDMLKGVRDGEASRDMCAVQTNFALIDGGREAGIVGSGLDDDFVRHGEIREE